MEKEINKTLGYFNTIAANYDNTHYTNVSKDNMLGHYKKVKDLIRRPLLELGCGTGNSTEYLMPDVASDFSEEMVSSTRKKVPGILIYKIDAHDIPFDDDEFSTTISFALLQHCINPKKVISEMVRVSTHNVVIVTNLFNKYSETNNEYLVRHFSMGYLKKLLSGYTYSTQPTKNGIIINILC